LLLLVIILDCFLYFGLGAVGFPDATQFGSEIGQLVDLDVEGNASAGVQDLIDYEGGETMVQASQLGWTSIGIGPILGFVGLIYRIMTVPLSFMHWLGAPVFVQVVVGGTYIVMVLASIAQLITGRFS